MTTPQQNLILASAGGEAVEGSSWSTVVSGSTYTKLAVNSDKSVVIYYNNASSIAGEELNNIIVHRLVSGTWQTITSPFSNPIVGIIWEVNRFIIYSTEGKYTSADGTNWSYSAGGVITSNNSPIQDYFYINGVYYCTATNVLYRSTDGETWTSVLSASPNSMAYGNGVIVATYSFYKFYSTNNGVTWSNLSVGSVFYGYHVDWNDAASRFVMTGLSFGNLCAVSSDGITWESVGNDRTTAYSSFSDTQGYSYILSGRANIYKLDPVNKTYTQISIPTLGSAVLYVGTTTIDNLPNNTFKYQARGEANAFVYSSTGDSWSGTAGLSAAGLLVDSQAPYPYIAGSRTGTGLHYSSNGTQWLGANIIGSTGAYMLYNRIIWDGSTNKYYAVASSLEGVHSEISVSSNGYTWEVTRTETSRVIKSIAADNAGTVVACINSLSNNILYSTNGGTTWNETSVSPTVYNLNDVIWDGSKFIAVGSQKSMFISYDGISWTLIHAAPQMNDIIKLGNNYIGVRNFLGSGEYPNPPMSISPSLLGPWKPLISSNFPSTTIYLGDAATNNTSTLVVTIEISSSKPIVYYSTDTTNGTTWYIYDTGRGSFTHISYVNNRFVICSSLSDGKFLMATDAQVLTNTWTTYTPWPTESGYTVDSVMYHAGYYYAVTTTGRVARSTDLSTWAEVFIHPNTTSTDRFLVSAFGSLFLYGKNTDSYVFDGSSWTLNTTNSTDMFDVRYIGNAIYSIHTYGDPKYSTDGSTFLSINSQYAGDYTLNNINSVDGKAIFTQYTNAKSGYYWQTTTDPTAEFSTYPFAPSFDNITYIEEEDAYHLAAGQKIIINDGSILAPNATYTNETVKILGLQESTSGFSNAYPTRTAYNKDSTNPAYVYGGTESTGLVLYSANPYTATFIPRDGTISGIVYDVVWDEYNEAFLLSDGQKLYRSE